MEKKIEVFLLILLAGGRSSRMGTPKGLLDYQWHPWIVEQLRRFKAASGKQAIIVLGSHQAQYFEQIPWLEKAVNQPVMQLGLEISVVVNPAPELGQFSSLQCAIALLKKNPSSMAGRPCPSQAPDTERFFPFENFPGAFILPIDVPCPAKEVFEKLTLDFHDSIDAVIPQYQYKSGHPVLLGGDFLRRLAEIPGSSPDARLDLQIRSLPQERVSFVSVDDQNICLNMNSMEIFQDFIQGEADSQKV
jgi:CTP:molybdopterin cytidylyltransferase MocA